MTVREGRKIYHTLEPDALRQLRPKRNTDTSLRKRRAALGASHSPAQPCPLSSGLSCLSLPSCDPRRLACAPVMTWASEVRSWLGSAIKKQSKAEETGVFLPFYLQVSVLHLRQLLPPPHRRCQRALSLGCGVLMDPRGTASSKVPRALWSRWSPASQHLLSQPFP